MNVFSQFILGISAAAVLIGALFMILPSGSMQKSVKYAFSLTFICICATAFLTLGKINFDFKVSSSAPDTANAQALTTAMAQQICGAVLKEKAITYEKIYVNTDKDETDSIFINSVTVYSSGDAALIEQAIRNAVEVKTVTVKR